MVIDDKHANRVFHLLLLEGGVSETGDSFLAEGLGS
jgi:hypothetical protein